MVQDPDGVKPKVVQAAIELLGGAGSLVGILIAAGGGGAAIAIAIFRFFGEKWLSTKFEERLTELKHRQGREIEKLKLEINLMFDRNVKLHQREFEIVPECWRLMSDAFEYVRGCVSPYQTYADVGRMNLTQLNEFLDGGSLLEWQKDELRVLNGAERMAAFTRISERHRIFDARERCRDFSTYLNRNSIFLTPELKQKMTELQDLLWAAMVDYDVASEGRTFRAMRDAYSKVDTEGKALRDEIASLVQSRLWSTADPAGASPRE